MKELTDRQKQVAKFIEDYFDTNGYAPSVRDIANHFGFSPKAAYDHLTALKKKNVIKTADNLPRGMALLKRFSQSEQDMIKIPLIGTTAAGIPINSEEETESVISLPQSLFNVSSSSSLYALHVRGDSMIGDGINDGDIAILVKTKNAENGDIVAASIGDDEEYGITLKHFYRKDDGRYELRSSNSIYQAMNSAHCDIHGKLIMIIRKY